MQSYKYVVRQLSRLLSETGKTTETSEREEYLRRIADESVPIAMNSNEIERASKKDEEIDEIRKCLKTGRWFEINFKEYLPVKSELCIGRFDTSRNKDCYSRRASRTSS
jgi:hypothetical protein